MKSEDVPTLGLLLVLFALCTTVGAWIEWGGAAALFTFAGNIGVVILRAVTR